MSRRHFWSFIDANLKKEKDLGGWGGGGGEKNEREECSCRFEGQFRGDFCFAQFAKEFVAAYVEKATNSSVKKNIQI